MEARYAERLSRYLTALRNGQPDRVPIRPFVAEFAAEYAGYTCQEATHDYEKAFAAVQRILAERCDFSPLSDRSIHYALLNDPPLRHAAKPGSTYTNDRPSYHNLTDLLSRAWANDMITGLVCEPREYTRTSASSC
jgi:hypothetical protein